MWSIGGPNYICALYDERHCPVLVNTQAWLGTAPVKVVSSCPVLARLDVHVSLAIDRFMNELITYPAPGTLVSFCFN